MENFNPKPEEFLPQGQVIHYSVPSPLPLQQYQPNPPQNNPFFFVPTPRFSHSNVVYNNSSVNNNNATVVYNDTAVNNLDNNNSIDDIFGDIVFNNLDNDNSFTDFLNNILVDDLDNDDNLNDVFSDFFVNNNNIHSNSNSNNVVHDGTVANDNVNNSVKIDVGVSKKHEEYLNNSNSNSNSNNVVHDGTVANDNVNNSVKIDVGVSKKHEEYLNSFGVSKKHEEHLNNFPPGYRFRPRDVELIGCYLTRKVLKLPLPPNKIRSIDIYLHNPEDLIRALSKNHVGPVESEWYFFTPRKRKYPNGTRPNRGVGEGDNIGYWKATGADKSIRQGSKTVGFRKTLVFYNGKPNGVKTNWIMHEYRMNKPPIRKKNEEDMRLDDWVLCKLHEKLYKGAKKAQEDDGEPQLGIVDEKLLLQDDSYFNQYNDGDSGDLMFNPTLLPGHDGYDPRFMINQTEIQNNQHSMG